jgi:hypothetical protein
MSAATSEVPGLSAESLNWYWLLASQLVKQCLMLLRDTGAAGNPHSRADSRADLEESY